jgi:hypothetical protein
MMQKIYLSLAAFGALALVGAQGCATTPQLAPSFRADSAALVTVLGRDTLALERWVRTGNVIEAEALVRSPRTTMRRYRMELADDGSMRRFEERTFDPAADATPTRVDVIARTGDGWTRTITQGDSTRTLQVEGAATMLPFVDLIHWPMEIATTRAVMQGLTTQPLLSGQRPQDFPLTRSGNTVTITHPLRGPSVATVDDRGRIISLDAGQTTRKVIVTRVPWVEIAETGRRWAAADRAGTGIGELSGRAREDYELAGATIQLDYGTPLRRDRRIFGVVVPYGQVWRTGANRATHFVTDRTLVLGPEGGATITVPPGEYTLFSIPTETGGELIVSRQTGQTGTAYNADRDLGRVRMTRAPEPERVERFTIDVVPTAGSAGELRIRWDDARYIVPVRVQ